MDHTRHLDLYNFPPGFTVTLIGAGGIGAITALTLAKMGLPILNVFDDDLVDDTNLPGQLHKLSDVGVPKVKALEYTLAEFADDTIYCPFQLRVTADTILPSTDVLISAVDSIDARKDIKIAMWGSNIPYYIDARMAAEQYQHYALNMSDQNSVNRYSRQLDELNEEDVEELPCTAKATFYTAAVAAGHISTAIKNVLQGRLTPHRLIHYIPEEILHKLDI